MHNRSSSETLVSIVIPCLNEEEYISECLKSVFAFELPEKVETEVLIVDGGSSDGTLNLARIAASRETRIRVLTNPARYQSHGLNIGIAAARGDWIMRLDAHAVYPKDYLRLCHETAQRSGADNVGGQVITLPGSTRYSAQIVQALTTHRFGVGNSGFRTGAPEEWTDTVPYGYFRREVFKSIGLFDERLVRAQDYEFNRRLRAAGGRILRNPAIKITYFNQRSLSAFLSKQLLREAPYNAYMWYLAPYSFAPRHAITAVYSSGVISGLLLSPSSIWICAPFLATMALYAAIAVFSAIQQSVRYREVRHAFALPVAFFLYHFIHGVGVLTGLVRLGLRAAPVQWTAEPWAGAGVRRLDPSELHVRRSELNSR